MRVGIAHHFGWAVAVTADDRHRVTDRRRIELVEEGVPVAPVHRRESGLLDDEALTALVEEVRASAVRAGAAALDAIAAAAAAPIASLSLRVWPDGFPTEIAVVRRVPYESRADSVMYRQVLAELAGARGWAVHRYDAGTVEREAAALLGARAGEVLRGPRSTLGPPWGRDQRIALAATVVAAREATTAGG